MRRIFAFLPLLSILLLFACEPTSPTSEKDASAGSTPSFPQPAASQAPPAERKVGDLEQSLIDSGLVDIQAYIPGIKVDLKYSTKENFVKLDVYGELTRCYLREEAAKKLKMAQALLQSEHPGWSMVVFDGVRPHHVQKIMWDSLNIPFKRNYLAPPWEGSVHNYGCAVDLSIVDENGQELDMGTPFDYFGKEAQPQLEGMMLAQGKLDSSQVANRKILRRIMKQAGFHDIQTEWWHFNAVANAEVRRKYSRIP